MYYFSVDDIDIADDEPISAVLGIPRAAKGVLIELEKVQKANSELFHEDGLLKSRLVFLESQLNEINKERDEAVLARNKACVERDEALKERDKAMELLEELRRWMV